MGTRIAVCRTWCRTGVCAIMSVIASTTGKSTKGRQEWRALINGPNIYTQMGQTAGFSLKYYRGCPSGKKHHHGTSMTTRPQQAAISCVGREKNGDRYTSRHGDDGETRRNRVGMFIQHGHGGHGVPGRMRSGTDQGFRGYPPDIALGCEEGIPRRLR